MAAYHIFGPSGSGKSTVSNILKARGFEVIDTDHEPGLSGWYDIYTNQQVFDLPPQPYSEEWIDRHRWRWSKELVEKLLASAIDTPVFFCGGADNEALYYPHFIKQFGLSVDNFTLKNRLQDREPNRWSDDSAELQRCLKRNEGFSNYCSVTNAIIIDATLSPENIADNILRYV